MYIINERRLRDAKMQQLQAGCSAYAESNEVIRLLQREIDKLQLHVLCDRTNTGCWFIPLTLPENELRHEC